MNNKKILYIGPYREFGGSGNSARNYIHALYMAGHDVCISPIYVTGDIYPENEISSEILPLENNHLKNYDIIIQHCHPCEYVYTKGVAKTIGIFEFNSYKLCPTLSSRLKLVDTLVVNSLNNQKIVKNLLPEHDIKYVPQLIDKNIVNQHFERYQWNSGSNRPYSFYLIGDFIHRKNFIKAINGYVTTFSRNDNVQLIIKTKPHYSHNNENILHKEIEYELGRVFDANKITKENAPDIKIMLGKFDYKQILTLHYNGDCYIDVSMGENFGFSTLEAALFNKNIIVNNRLSSYNIPSSKYGVSAKPINTYDPYDKNFISNRTNNLWFDIDFEDYIKSLKIAYTNRYDSVCTNELNEYDYSNIDQLLC